jgi:hypothetical protein
MHERKQAQCINALKESNQVNILNLVCSTPKTSFIPQFAAEENLHGERVYDVYLSKWE